MESNTIREAINVFSKANYKFTPYNEKEVLCRQLTVLFNKIIDEVPNAYIYRIWHEIVKYFEISCTHGYTDEYGDPSREDPDNPVNYLLTNFYHVKEAVQKLLRNYEIKINNVGKIEVNGEISWLVNTPKKEAYTDLPSLTQILVIYFLISSEKLSRKTTI